MFKINVLRGVSWSVLLGLYLAFLSSCTPKGVQTELSEEDYEYTTYGLTGGVILLDEEWLAQKGRFSPSQRVVWYPVQYVDYRLASPCDSCHGASASYFEFEHIGILRDSLANVLGNPDYIRELTPGIEGIGGNSQIDSVVFKTLKELSKSSWSFSNLDSISPVHDFITTQRPSELEELYKLLKNEVQADMIILPLQTEVVLYPKDNEPEGSVRLKNHWVLWDLNTDKILLHHYMNILWLSGGNRIDRETSQYLTQPMFQLIRGLSGDVPKWAL